MQTKTILDQVGHTVTLIMRQKPTYHNSVRRPEVEQRVKMCVYGFRRLSEVLKKLEGT